MSLLLEVLILCENLSKTGFNSENEERQHDFSLELVD